MSETTTPTTLMVAPERASVQLTPVLTADTAMARLTEFQTFIGQYLTESKDGGNDGGDYGLLPGSNKRILLRSGADKLCEVYGIYDEYEITANENWDTGLFDYLVVCKLRSRKDDSLVGSGVGSCSTYEAKYRWRTANRACPTCGQETIIRGREEYGGGWVCLRGKGGCGAKYDIDDRAITTQIVGRVENPDLADAKNTVLKMAKKRAKVDAVIGATRSSGIFTQDLEELPDHARVVEAKPVASERVAAPASAPAARPAAPRTPPATVPSAPADPPAPSATPGGSPAAVTIKDVTPTHGRRTDGSPYTRWKVEFGGRVRTSDGGVVTNASTFDDTLATAFENARDTGALVFPVVEPGRKRGTYDLKGIEFPANR